MTISPQDPDPATASEDTRPYFVLGGRYADTTFTTLLEPAPIEGPYKRRDDAIDVWRANSMRHIDEAFVRYLIVQADSADEAAQHAEERPERPARSA